MNSITKRILAFIGVMSVIGAAQSNEPHEGVTLA